MQTLLLHQQILVQTERLRDLHRALMMHSNPIPATELENFLQEIRNLYSITLQLNNENALQLLNEVSVAANRPEKPGPESIRKSEPEIESDGHKNELKPAGNITPSQTPVADPDSHRERKQTFQNGQNDKKRLADVNEKFQEAVTVANSFSERQTLGDRIAGDDTKKRVSENIRIPVTDLKSAIGLNEKFQFINQLFQGDAKKYNAFIDQLNTSPSAETAMQSIKEISDANDWEAHAASARSFIDVVERRFSA